MKFGRGSSTPQIVRTAPVVESLIAPSVDDTTLIAPAPDPTKRKPMIMKSEPAGRYMPDEDRGRPTSDPLSPEHYQWHPVCEAQTISGHFPHHLGAAIDYIWRVGRKDAAIEDINKAIRHLEFERDRLMSMRPDR